MREHKNFRFRYVFKLTVFFLLCVFTPLSAIFAYNLVDIKSRHNKQLENDVNNAVIYLEQSFRKELYRYDEILSSITKNRLIIKYPELSSDPDFADEANRLIRNFVTGEMSVFRSVRFYYFNSDFAGDHEIFLHAAEVSDEKWYKDFFATEEYYVWRFSPAAQENALVQIVKLYDDTEMIGVAVAEVSFENIVNTVAVESRSRSLVFACDSKKPITSLTSNGNKEMGLRLFRDIELLKTSLYDSSVHFFRVDNMFFAVSNIPQFGITIGCGMEAESDMELYSSSIFLILVFLALVIFISAFCYAVFHIFTSLEKDVQKMNDFVENNISGRLKIRRNDVIGRLEQQFNFMLDKMDALKENIILKEQAKKHAELTALQNQTNPHFIYNMLNTFRMKLDMNGDSRTADEIAKFGKLLRYNMTTRDHTTTLKDEITYLNYYLDLQNERFSEQILYDDAIPIGYSDVRIPRFIFQPLAENSIKYGRKPGASLKITVSFESIVNDQLLVSFTDNGRGCDKKTVSSLNSQFASGHYILKSQTENSSTIGLKNINERIRLIYGEEYHITVSSEENSYFEVLFRFPLK